MRWLGMSVNPSVSSVDDPPSTWVWDGQTYCGTELLTALRLVAGAGEDFLRAMKESISSISIRQVFRLPVPTLTPRSCLFAISWRTWATVTLNISAACCGDTIFGVVTSSDPWLEGLVSALDR